MGRPLRRWRPTVSVVGIVMVFGPGGKLIGLLLAMGSSRAGSLAYRGVERDFGLHAQHGGGFAKLGGARLRSLLVAPRFCFADELLAVQATLKLRRQVLRPLSAAVLLVLPLVGFIRSKQQRLDLCGRSEERRVG